MTDLEFLKTTARELEVWDIAKEILEDASFADCSGAGIMGQHHYGDGGLVRHVAETWRIALHSNQTLQDKSYTPDDQLFLACLFHDVGKMWDYEKVNGRWGKVEHNRMIHHISRSNVQWNLIATKHNVDQHMIDSVSHAILSHHGRREWGSPVAPKTRLAWILYLADSMSARMDDCETVDILKLNKRF